jgi:hypothetical protein
MDIRIVREFIKRYPSELFCEKDNRALLPNLRHDDTIYLYCLECSDTIEIGYNSYDRMKRVLTVNE